MDISGLSSILNQTSRPLGKEKEKLNFRNTNMDAVIQKHFINLHRLQLPSAEGLTAGTANGKCVENRV